jgi:hypothetical protein
MTELELIEQLARRARGERSPAVQVEAAVIEALRVPQRGIPIRPLAFMAVGAAVAAVVVLALVLRIWAGPDPLAALFPSLEVSLL